MFFTFPDDARWNENNQCVEFSVEVGEYTGVVRVARIVFRYFLDGSVTPERCIEAYHLARRLCHGNEDWPGSDQGWPAVMLLRRRLAIAQLLEL